MTVSAIDNSAKMGNEATLSKQPNVGELWTIRNRVAVVCGNTIRDDGTLWVMGWNSGVCGYFTLKEFIHRKDRFSVTDKKMVNRFSKWARSGNADAMWFLAWWFEGTNHPKSVWYYIAALRAYPKKHKWAYQRVIQDATHPICCQGIPLPDLQFLEKIPEIYEPKILSNKWQEAVKMAEEAIHTPDPDELPMPNGRLYLKSAGPYYGPINMTGVKVSYIIQEGINCRKKDIGKYVSAIYINYYCMISNKMTLLDGSFPSSCIHKSLCLFDTIEEATNSTLDIWKIHGHEFKREILDVLYNVPVAAIFMISLDAEGNYFLKRVMELRENEDSPTWSDCAHSHATDIG